LLTVIITHQLLIVVRRRLIGLLVMSVNNPDMFSLV
jgi:hypothetical protein